MSDTGRRAKVTPENKQEARKLSELWASRSHPSQAEFGETYKIGNQSAVGQFLRGNVPLSLKAAKGFALGLGCRIEDFSPRLAAEAAGIASFVPADNLPPDVAQLASAIAELKGRQRTFFFRAAAQALDVAKELPAVEGSRKQAVLAQETHPKRGRAG
jgi:hypothetical protein